MAINYNGIITGTMKVEQTWNNKKTTFKYEFRQSNCLACIIHVTKNPKSIGKNDKYIHGLICFFTDKEHLKRCAKAEGGLKSFFGGTIKEIRLNTFYKDNITLMEYFTKAGCNVICYYKEPTRK